MSKYEGYNESRKKASMKYNAQSREKLGLNLPKGTKEQWQRYAAERGLSLTEYIRSLIEKDNEE